MLNEDTENRVFEPLITLTSKDQDWPPLVQSLPGKEISVYFDQILWQAINQQLNLMFKVFFYKN